jgi:hypothetical protein
LPVPVLLKRFFAPVCVFNLGIFFSLSAKVGSPWRFAPETGTSLPSLGFNQYTADCGLKGTPLHP